MGGGEIQKNHIRIHTFLQHTAGVCTTLGTGTAEGGHHQRRLGGDRLYLALAAAGIL